MGLIAPTHAITLWPEWAWAVAYLDKDVENRGWPIPKSFIGARIAIHAGAQIGGRRGERATREGLAALRSTALAAGWAVAPKPGSFGDGSIGMRAISAFSDRVDQEAPIVCSAIVAVATITPATDGSSPWANPAGWSCWWSLGDVVTLDDPIGGVRGSQMLWRIPPHVRVQIEDQIT